MLTAHSLESHNKLETAMPTVQQPAIAVRVDVY